MSNDTNTTKRGASLPIAKGLDAAVISFLGDGI